MKPLKIVCSLCTLEHSKKNLCSRTKKEKLFNSLCKKLQTLNEKEKLSRVKKAWKENNLYYHRKCSVDVNNKERDAAKKEEKKSFPL